MSFIITLLVREGIIMASDSRTTFSQVVQSDEKSVTNLAVGCSDFTDKLFVMNNSINNLNIAISWYGQAQTGNVQIPVIIRNFSEYFSNYNEIFESYSQIPEIFLDFVKNNVGDLQFRKLETGFHISGYFKNKYEFMPFVYDVQLKGKNVIKLNNDEYPLISWNGEGDILSRLIHPVSTKQNGNYHEIPFYPLNAQFFSLHDAADFAMFAVNVTKKMIKFQQRPKTVGGKTDMIALLPNGEYKWIMKKKFFEGLDKYEL